MVCFFIIQIVQTNIKPSFNALAFTGMFSVLCLKRNVFYAMHYFYDLACKGVFLKLLIYRCEGHYEIFVMFWRYQQHLKVLHGESWIFSKLLNLHKLLHYASGNNLHFSSLYCCCYVVDRTIQRAQWNVESEPINNCDHQQ